jgi:hypothetical protein
VALESTHCLKTRQIDKSPQPAAELTIHAVKHSISKAGHRLLTDARGRFSRRARIAEMHASARLFSGLGLNLAQLNRDALLVTV